MNKTKKLLFKNAFRTAWRNPSQIVGLSSLIMLVSMIISLLASTSTRVIDAYDQLILDSNLRDSVMEIDSTTSRLKEPTNYNLEKWDSQEVYQQWILNYLSHQYNFSWSRTEARTFSSAVLNERELLIKVLVKTDQDENTAVDKMIISEGRDLNTDEQLARREIIVGESFALANEIQIGDIIRVQEDQYGDELFVKSNPEIASEINSWDSFYEIDNSEYVGMNWFEVVGFGTSADFVTPIIDSSTVLPNVKNEAIMYVHESLFGFSKLNYCYEQYNEILFTFENRDSVLATSSLSDREIYYSLKFNNSVPSNEIIQNLNKDFKEIGGIEKEINFFYLNTDSNYRFYSRVSTFNSVIQAFNLTTIALLIIILLISVFTIVLITKKQVDNMKKQIGCLKSLGYKKREIINSFIATPLIVTIMGSILGYILSIFINGIIVGVFSNYFNIAFIGFSFNLIALIFSILFIWAILTLTVTIMAAYTLRDTALNLLKGNADRGISKFGLTIKKVTSRNNFSSNLRSALLTTSLGKLFGVSITMLLGTFMLTTTIIAPKVLNDNMTATFNGLNFENQIEYTSPIASNPLSFYRTYNPNFSSDDWGYSDDKFVQTYAGKNKVSAKTASPVKNGKIDAEKIITEIMSGNIHSQFYNIDIFGDETGSNENPYSWSVMSYLNYKNLSTDFLKNLDEVHMDDSLINDIGLNTLLDQWVDFGIFKDEVQSATEIKELTESLLWFYKKYTSGIAIPYNPSFTNSFGLDHWDQWNWDDGKIIDSMFTNKKDLWNGDDGQIYDLQNTNFKPILNEKTNMAEIDFYQKDIKNMSSDDFSLEEAECLNQALILWYTATFQNRLGAVVLETAYSRAPYFVQQYLKEAYENNKLYNISFNLVPYDPFEEEIGTYFNAEFDNRKNIKEDVKIYGIDKNSKLLDLRTEKGDFLNNKLFESNYEDDDVIPIVINQTMAIKGGYKTNDIIDLDVIKNEVYQNNVPLTIKDFSTIEQDPFKEYRTQSSRTYYSSKGKSFVDNPTFLNNVKPIKYGDSAIASKNAMTSTETTPIHTSVLEGKTYLTQTTQNYNKFKVVGIQDGYGKAQGWIANDKANQILEYDKVKKYTFENYFLNEWVFLPEFASTINNDEVVDFLKQEPTYEKFLEKLNTDVENKEDWNKVNTLFNNLYPVFNYKNSPNSEFLDLTQGFSSTQKFGDFGARGLNGTYSEDKNTGEILDFVEGLGIGSLSTMMPLEKTRQILGQITQIVNITMILFMVIALIVSITIILLTTGLIIYENKEFIATMKILGYSNRYIIRQILGMYLLPILLTFILGFILGWFIFLYAINLLALATTWVLPVTFAWWIPASVFLIIFGIYALSFITGWINIQKINPLEALKAND